MREMFKKISEQCSKFRHKSHSKKHLTNIKVRPMLDLE